MEKDSKKEGFVFDTSSLISLETINLVEKVLSVIDIIVTPSVIQELEDFAQFDDRLGEASKRILKYKNKFTIKENTIKDKIRFIQKTDNELYNLAKNLSLILITDDLKFSRHIEGKIETEFSTFFLPVLIELGEISKKKSLELLDILQDSRNWRSNEIYLTSKKELEKIK